MVDPLSFLSSKNKGKPMPPVEPKLPPAPRLSERWASAREEVLQLEDTISDLQSHLKAETHRADVAEDLLSHAKTEVAELKMKLDRVQRRLGIVLGYMRSGAHIFLQCLDQELKEEPKPLPPEQEIKALSAVADELEHPPLEPPLEHPHE